MISQLLILLCAVHPQNIEIKNFSYLLPEERIAKYPLAERDSSKLLVWQNGEITQSTYLHVESFIPESSLLVFNNSKVIQARLLFQTATGAKVEIFCLEPANNLEVSTAMGQRQKVRWKCLVGRAAKWKEKTLVLKINEIILFAEIAGRTNDSFLIDFFWQPERLSFAELLDKTGVIPIPPYLKRETEQIDTSRYQTIYAKQGGSVAAPTAGLHFTESVFEKLRLKNCGKEEVTLHVGAGTFKPVKSETLQTHEMHEEWMDVGLNTIESLIEQLEKDLPVIAVGTTSLRTIESLYWMGAKARNNIHATKDHLEVKQWDAYEIPSELSAINSLRALKIWMEKKEINRLICKTQILIAPPYRLKVVRALITNFHQPNSTLLLLVASVVGEKWKIIYQYALENDFRFLSYGDGSLLFADV